MIDACPACGEDDFEILRETASKLTRRCVACGDVATLSPRRLRVVALPLVLSDGDMSRRDHIETPSDEAIAVGHEFDMDGHRYIVTGIETPEGQVKGALASQIKVVQAKRFDTVAVKIAVNEGAVTKSYRIDVDPDTEFHVGQVIDVGDRLLVAKTMKSDQNRTLHKGFLLARNIRRIFCDPAPPRAKEGEVVTTRRRGKPPGAPSKPRRGPKR